MKPLIFESADELLGFLNRLPVPEGTVRGSDGEMIDATEVISRTKALVPKIFRVREVLVKQPGGFGNLKSFRRYTEIVTDNASAEACATLERTLEDLNQEVEDLIAAGASEELAGQLRAAKSNIARFNMIKSSILAHQAKLLQRINAVEKAFENMVNAINYSIRAVKDGSVRDELRKAKAKLEGDMDELEVLIKAVIEYNSLQISFNSMMLADRAKAS